MSERLFGIETEYAVSAFGPSGSRIDQDELLEALMRRARDALPHLPEDHSRGMFLQNGARFYLDAGGHPEFTTPECTTPADVVRFVRAGEAVLLRIADGATSIYRTNVDYSGTGSTWGCHESYMHTVDPEGLPAQLVPHLVSRVVYTGAGGFDNVSPGLRFTLSPRATHVHQVVSGESTNRRGIFHTKNEPLCVGGYNRMHVIFGESLGSDLAIWLKVGTTALVVALCELGLQPGSAMTLDAPVAAARLFAGDPTCTAATRTTSGPRTAVAIQRHYLQQVEAQLGSGVLPSWAGEVCRRWREVLDRLEAGEETVATALDWAVKRTLFGQHASRRGFSWESIGAWTTVAERLSTILGHTTFRSRKIRATILRGLTPRIWTQVEPELRAAGLAWEDFGRFLDLRDELFELDVRFGQLGEHGVFQTLDRAGALDHRVDGDVDVAAAIEGPPAAGRARIRGLLVRQLSGAGDRYCCNWSSVCDFAESRYVDLSDPFAESTEWKSLADRERDLLSPHVPSRLLRMRLETPGAAQPSSSPAVAHLNDPVLMSECARQHRMRGSLGEAERIFREAIAIEDARVPPDSPKRPHRRTHLAMVLLRAGRFDEAARVNAEAWRLKAGRHDVVSGRILFLRVALGFLRGDHDVRLFLGQLKTVLHLEPLECLANVTRTWEIPDVIDALCDQLPDEPAALLVHLAEALNDSDSVSLLDVFGAWREADPVSLDVVWPAE